MARPPKSLMQRLRELGSPQDALALQRFFKTGPGEYGEGDRFLGIRSAPLRRLAREARGLSLADIARLLDEPWHEARSLALLLLVDGYAHGGRAERDAICRMYLRSTPRINNWDLVDSSASQILGAHLSGGDRPVLRRLARSRNLWERRIAIVATHAFIRRGEFGDTLELAASLMRDEHDLMHKAVGWMLREVGKRDREQLEAFLALHAHEMPRTMLRYAIERLPAARRARYMRAKTPV